ncbi:hypothetical protein GCM10010129_52740 [Streptomyces fumigatiscleroticus]|nr:hypothetical protein GCM10010129_52740 [Streptomyces fumigatiscleroticus]
MTQSGQGEEPSARFAREGIVLPSDGGDPLLPGTTGGPGGPPGQPAPGRAPASPPPGGQTWDQPWGPDRHQAPAPGQEWQSAPPAQGWGAHGAPAPGPGPLPPEGAQTPAYGGQSAYAPNGQVPAAPPQTGAAGHAGAHTPGAYAASAPLPPVDAGATQYLPPVGAAQPPAPADQATQYLPPVAAPADEGATQYIPPVAPGALPPERGAETPSESTHFLGRAPQHGPRPGAGPLPPAASGPDAEATQYIAPVTDQPAGAPYGGVPGQDADRQPPAEFDSLFRGGPGGDAPAASTQQLPRYDQPQAPHPAARPLYAPPGPAGGGRRGRTGSRVPLIAAVGIGIAVVGVGAGALLAGGGGDGQDVDDQTVSATAPATEGSASPSVDPVRQQAVELDKLLADSGSSRTTVINAVADVKSCDNLSQAARDLRDAARQRNDLVTRLSALSVDQLPDHAALTTALTKAWQASASADNHYAAWADQAAGKKGCKKGQARNTDQTQAGNRASSTASTEKAKAADLWNKIAKTYGLTEREPTQL